MTREEALTHTNKSHTQELSKKDLVNKIYDDFEKQLEDAKAQGFREAIKEMGKVKGL